MESTYSLLFLGGVGVVEAQVALAAVLLGEAEVEADRLGVADVQVAVRLRREARVDAAAEPAGAVVLLDDLLDEVQRAPGRSGLSVRFCLGTTAIGCAVFADCNSQLNSSVQSMAHSRASARSIRARQCSLPRIASVSNSAEADALPVTATRSAWMIWPELDALGLRRTPAPASPASRRRTAPPPPALPRTSPAAIRLRRLAHVLVERLLVVGAAGRPAGRSRRNPGCRRPP